MGQKQILLIVLAIILVGVAVSFGLQMYDNEKIERNRESVLYDLNTLATFAHQHYTKTVEQGGGGKSFIGFTIPASLDSTTNGTYEIVFVRDQRVLLQGTGVEYAKASSGCSASENKVTYQLSVTPTENVSKVIY